MYLAGDPGRVAPFFHKAGFVEDQHAIGVLQMLDDIGPQCITRCVGVPVGPAQQILEAIGGGLAADFCHLPAVLALRLTEQAAQIRHDPLAGLRAGEIRGQPPRNIRQVGQAAFNAGGGRIGRRQ